MLASNIFLLLFYSDIQYAKRCVTKF